MIDAEKVLPSWRFVLSPEMRRDAEEFRLFIKRDWVPFGWTDDQVTRWVENRVIGLMPERWPMIHKIDQNLDGLISKTLRLMCVRPRDMPPGYIYNFGNAFFDISGPDGVRAAFKVVIDHKLKGAQKGRFLEPGEEEYDDARMVSVSTISSDIMHKSDRIAVEND